MEPPRIPGRFTPRWSTTTPPTSTRRRTSGVTPGSAIQVRTNELNALLTPILDTNGNSTVEILRSDVCGRLDGRLCDSLVGETTTNAVRTKYSPIGVHPPSRSSCLPSGESTCQKNRVRRSGSRQQGSLDMSRTVLSARQGRLFGPYPAGQQWARNGDKDSRGCDEAHSHDHCLVAVGVALVFLLGFGVEAGTVMAVGAALLCSLMMVVVCISHLARHGRAPHAAIDHTHRTTPKAA
jgi:hypothetical protein